MDHQSRLLSCFKSSFKFVIAKTTRQKEKNKKEYKGDEGNGGDEDLKNARKGLEYPFRLWYHVGGRKEERRKWFLTNAQLHNLYGY